jgi:hypothetical protein
MVVYKIYRKGTYKHIQRLACARSKRLRKSFGEFHAGCGCGRVQVVYHKINKLIGNFASW